MLKIIVHWLIFLAVVINLVSCLFGQAPSFPEQPF
jgi:cytochrome b561